MSRQLNHNCDPMCDRKYEDFSSLFGNNEERIKEYIKENKMTLINAIVEEIGETVMETCQIPNKEDSLSSTKETPLELNATGWMLFQKCETI